MVHPLRPRTPPPVPRPNAGARTGQGPHTARTADSVGHHFRHQRRPHLTARPTTIVGYAIRLEGPADRFRDRRRDRHLHRHVDRAQ